MKRAILLLAAALAAYSQEPVKLTLDEAEAQAVKQNPQVSVALLNALAANQVTIQFRSLLYPQINGAVTAVGGEETTRIGAGQIGATTVYNRFSVGGSLSQLVTDFGRTRLLVDSAKFRAEAAGLFSNATRSLVLLQVRRAYYSALRARAVLKVARETVATRKLVADQVAALAASNLKSGLDVSFANVNLAEARLLLAQAENEVKALDAELSAAIGYPQPRSFELVDTPMPAAPALDPEAMIGTALKERPDLLSLRSDLSAAMKFASSEAALWRPSVVAQGAVGDIPAHQQSLIGHYSVAGVNMNIPVFNGRQFNARRAEADLRARGAAERVRDLESRIARDVQTAWLSSANALERYHLTGELVAQSGLALDLAQSRYELGLSSIVELTQAQLAKTAADIQRATALYEFQIQTSVLSFQQGLLK